MPRKTDEVPTKRIDEAYRRLVFAVANQAWADIQLYLKTRTKSLTPEILNRRERDYRTSVHFFTAPYYGEGERYPDISYFAHLCSIDGASDGMAQKLRKLCFAIEREISEGGTGLEAMTGIKRVRTQ